MSKLFFYDTETTGLPVWKSPSASREQPHLVQLAAILYDDDKGQVDTIMDVIIRPCGWEIEEEAFEVHGITMEHARAVGVDEREAIGAFLDLRADHVRIAHNRTFDQRIIRIALARYRKGNEGEQDRWARKDDHDCTMLMCNKHGCKVKNLQGAYQHFIGSPLEGAHTALNDAQACMEVYLAMREWRKTNC